MSSTDEPHIHEAGNAAENTKPLVGHSSLNVVLHPYKCVYKVSWIGVLISSKVFIKL